jgi:hypothetical protein
LALLGPLVKNRRNRDAGAAWNRPNLLGPETLLIVSPGFENGGTIPRENIGKRVGGRNLSPELTWSLLPPETTRLLLAVEDLDVPTSKPAVHCLVLVDPSRLDDPDHLPAGALSARRPGAGVQILRSAIMRGYQGPEPLKGHGPHRYTFQLFALSGERISTIDAEKLKRASSSALLSSITASVVGRGRITGIYER